MALAVSALKANRLPRVKELLLKVVASGNYVAGGDTLNLGSISNPLFLGDVSVGFPGLIEEYEVVDSPPGYQGSLIPGATLGTWKLQVFQTGAALSGPLGELAAAAYPGAITASFFVIRIAGPKGRV
jgi:hypothetical protein